jgi:hypothetical protein
MSFLTVFFVVFTIILYIYLLMVRRELIFVAMRRSAVSVIVPILIAIFLAILLFFVEGLEDRVRTIVAILMVLSYLFNVRGLTKDRFVMHSLDNRGIKLSEIERIVIFKDQRQSVIKLNFFRKGMRGPLFKFQTSLEELIPFLTSNLYEDTKIEVIVNTDKNKEG